MAIYTNSDGYSFVQTFSNISKASATIVETVDFVPKRMPEYHYYRTLWWEKGDFNPKAKWEEATQCDPVFGTDGSIIPLGAIRTRADDSEKEGDASFRPEKPRVRPPNGSDGKGEPWPNIVIEVAYSESESHVLEKAKYFWLRNWSRAHDVIVVKIDKSPEEDQAPLRMQAWHFCARDRIRRSMDIQPRAYFEFGIHDKDGNPTNIQPGQCVINISLDCLYHDAFPEATTHRQLLPDPIVLDFLIIRNQFLRAYRIR
ncbi:12544_t:CDS:2 [Acaulospora morrowiae]|uniref:12544_t:CDS:1 n=1 Tax=Acaulospora morrowiae TaxID=94023 RepID=A0A9N9BJ26_9GLOM|nr:12544_t:CDS:2 [Acaulospora morrowiae]